MLKSNLLLIFIAFAFFANCKEVEQNDFETLNNSSSWNLKFQDSCLSDWQNNWFLDGLEAKVEHNDKGMNFSAGPENKNNAHHAVLWTKESFEGDIKIEYNYTRTDDELINVNLLYIQATGVGLEERGEDITEWNKYREVPTMSKYFYNMNLLHISYAAYTVKGDPQSDYIRIRKYPAEKDKFKETEILPAYFNTGLFALGKTYKITAIKTKTNFYFNVADENENRLFSWELNEDQSPIKGRIGLRHMYTRSAQYSNFKVYTR